MHSRHCDCCCSRPQRCFRCYLHCFHCYFLRHGVAGRVRPQEFLGHCMAHLVDWLVRHYHRRHDCHHHYRHHCHHHWARNHYRRHRRQDLGLHYDLKK